MMGEVALKDKDPDAPSCHSRSSCIEGQLPHVSANIQTTVLIKQHLFTPFSLITLLIMENMSDRKLQTPLAERKKRNCTKWVKSLIYSDRLEGGFPFLFH